MRIQNINQNNYKSQNIGFESTHHITVHMPSCKSCQELCVDIFSVARKRAYEKAMPKIQKIGGSLNIQENRQVTFLIADEATDPELSAVIERFSADSEIPKGQLEKDMHEIERAMRAESTTHSEIILTRDDINMELAEIGNPDATCGASSKNTMQKIGN